MIRLKEIYQDGMLLQRQKPWKLMGNSAKEQQIGVYLNGKELLDTQVAVGEFTLTLPPQEAAEDAVLEIRVRETDGKEEQIIRFVHVDFGEVWVAGGQSNMEFPVKYDCEEEKISGLPEDAHLRYYEVGKYCFPEEKADGFKEDNKWDCWLTFTEEDRENFSAAATWFALELRKACGVPVGIISCNWGGTSALSWIDEETMNHDEMLAPFLREYEEKIAGMDMEQYLKNNYAARASMASPMAKASNDYMLKNTVTMEEVVAYSMKLAKEAGFSKEQMRREDAAPIEAFSAVGPRDANRPCGLYGIMLKKAAGYTARGFLWYQGEADAERAADYGHIFRTLVQVWRKAWGEELPVLFVQLAPFGTWMQATGQYFPQVRARQEEAQRQIAKSYLISTSDCGNEHDIHPKNKRPIGHRLALLARKYVYGEDLLADAPRMESLAREGDCLKIRFANGSGLHVEGETVFALRVMADGIPVTDFDFSVEEDCLCLRSAAFPAAKEIGVSFAKTPYYRVNLYNRAGLPAFPFEACCPLYTDAKKSR